MNASESPRRVRGASSTGKVATGIPQAADNPRLGAIGSVERPEEYEQTLEAWARGWDAAAAFYNPRLENLEAENDRLYLRAFNSAAEVKRILTARANAGLAEHADRWLAGEVS